MHQWLLAQCFLSLECVHLTNIIFYEIFSWAMCMIISGGTVTLCDGVIRIEALNRYQLFYAQYLSTQGESEIRLHLACLYVMFCDLDW